MTEINFKRESFLLVNFNHGKLSLLLVGTAIVSNWGQGYICLRYLIVVPHVHATVQHDILASNGNDDTTPPHV